MIKPASSHATQARSSPRRASVGATLALLLLAGLVVAFAPFPGLQSSQPTEHTFEIRASQYAYKPGTLRVASGDTVTIELVSTDVVHGLYLDGYDLSVQSDPGQTASLTFKADRPGAFRFRCNVTCGAMHPFMIGRLTVGSNTTLYRSAALTLIAVVGMLVVPRSSTRLAFP